MSDDEDPKGADEMPRTESTAARKARVMLANPKLQQSLAELRAMTPAGEPLFGFPLKLKDARDEVPAAERIELEGGAAIIADKEAAAAYAESVEPTAGLSPRMPTGRVRLNAAAAAPLATASSHAPQRQITQPSLARGGPGPRPPSIEDEGHAHEVTALPAVPDRAAPPLRAASANEPPVRRRFEPSRWRVWTVPALGLLSVVVVAILALRTPEEKGTPGRASAAPPAATARSTTSSAPATTTAPAVKQAPSAVETSSSAPAVSSPSSSATSVQARPGVPPTITPAPPAPTSAPSVAPSASTAANVAPSATPSVAPTSSPRATAPPAPTATVPLGKQLD